MLVNTSPEKIKPKAFMEFENGRMKPSSYYDRLVNVMEELVRFTLLLCDRAYSVD